MTTLNGRCKSLGLSLQVYFIINVQLFISKLLKLQNLPNFQCAEVYRLFYILQYFNISFTCLEMFLKALKRFDEADIKLRWQIKICDFSKRSYIFKCQGRIEGCLFLNKTGTMHNISVFEQQTCFTVYFNGCQSRC